MPSKKNRKKFHHFLRFFYYIDRIFLTVYNMVCELIKLISTPYFLCLILGDKNEPIRYNGINNKQYAISK